MFRCYEITFLIIDRTTTFELVSSRGDPSQLRFSTRLVASGINEDILLIHPSGVGKTRSHPSRSLTWSMMDSSTCNAFFTGISRHNRRLSGGSFVGRTIALRVAAAPLHRHRQFGRICFGTWGVVSRHETNASTMAALLITRNYRRDTMGPREILFDVYRGK